MVQIILTGPTASGKGSVAFELAGRMGASIACMDSMKVYRGMDIVTAKPPRERRERCLYHLIDLVDPEEEFSVGEYLPLLEDALGTTHAKQWAKQWRGVTFPPIYDGEPVFLHDDLGSSHMLFSPETKQLVGIIDFADQALGAPERDLVGMLTWMGEPFVREIAQSYGVESILPDDTAWERLRLSTVLAATRWIQDAQTVGEEMEGWRVWLHEQLAPMLQAMR